MTVIAVITWLTLHGCSLIGAAGITANLQVESGLDPASVSRSGIGLSQYAGIRRLRFLAALGARWRDGETQLGYVRQEAIALGIWDRVCSARSAATAATIFMREFERPRNRDPRRRAALAEGYLR